MKLNRIIAMTAAISITAGVFYNVGKMADVNTANSSSIFGDIDGDGAITPGDASTLLSYYAYLSTVVGEPMTLEEYLVYNGITDDPYVPDWDPIDSSVGTGGDTFTIASWSPDDVPYLIAQWKGLDYQTISEDLANDRIDGVKFISFGVGGGDASERYDQIFAAGDDLDVYFCEDTWGRKYIEDDNRTLDLSKLGLTDMEFPNMYSYTDYIGKDSKGYRKGVSWMSWAGAYAYRADLAEEYLGVTSPEEMQEKIGDWNGFCNAAQTVRERSNYNVAMADSLAGMYYAFLKGRSESLVIDGKINFRGNGAAAFVDIAKKMWDTGAVSHNAQWSDEWLPAGVEGKTMGYFVPTWGLDSFFLEASGGYNDFQYGKWKMCQGPQPYYLGGSWILVNPDTDNGEEARDFIFSAVCDESQMKEYALNKPEFVNNMAVMDELIAQDTVFNEVVTNNFVDSQNIYDIFDSNAKAIDYSNVTIGKNDGQAELLIAEGFTLMIQNGYSWDEAEEKVNKAFANGNDYID